MNPDGYQYTFDHERLWRKNLRDNDGDGQTTDADGVDPNRNYPEHCSYDEEGSSEPSRARPTAARPRRRRPRRRRSWASRRVAFRVQRQLPLQRPLAALPGGLADQLADRRRPDLLRAVGQPRPAGDRGTAPRSRACCRRSKSRSRAPGARRRRRAACADRSSSGSRCPRRAPPRSTCAAMRAISVCHQPRMLSLSSTLIATLPRDLGEHLGEQRDALLASRSARSCARRGRRRPSAARAGCAASRARPRSAPRRCARCRSAAEVCVVKTTAFLSFVSWTSSSTAGMPSCDGAPESGERVFLMQRRHAAMTDDDRLAACRQEGVRHSGRAWCLTNVPDVGRSTPLISCRCQAYRLGPSSRGWPAPRARPGAAPPVPTFQTIAWPARDRSRQLGCGMPVCSYRGDLQHELHIHQPCVRGARWPTKQYGDSSSRTLPPMSTI